MRGEGGVKRMGREGPECKRGGERSDLNTRRVQHGKYMQWSCDSSFVVLRRHLATLRRAR
eukprot:1997340-Pleurochrysis_carterae.AAC.1